MLLRLLSAPTIVYDARFGPIAQTPTQRAMVLKRWQDTLPDLKIKATAHARQLPIRYAEGELS